MRDGDLHLKPARPGDLALIDQWMARPDIRRWWGRVVESRRDVRYVMSQRYGEAFPFLIMLTGHGPIGYVQIINATLLDDWPQSLPQNAFDLDILIAAPDLREKGLGTWVIKKARSRILRELGQPAPCPQFTAWVLGDNLRSRRAFEKAGYRLLSADGMEALSPWTVMINDGCDG